MEANVSGQRWDIPEGTVVIDANGDDLGRVTETRPGLLVVEKGRIFPHDFYVPRAAIAGYDGDRVRLAVDRDEVVARRWDREPGTEPYGDEAIADDIAVGLPGWIDTGAPGYVEDPESERTSGTANRTTLDRSS